MSTKKYTPEQVERMAKGSCMSVCTQPGMEVIFVRFEAGWPREREEMKQLGFELGARYTVTNMDVGQSSTSIKLKEFPGKSFNSVFFANKPRQKLPNKIVGWDWLSPKYFNSRKAKPTPQP